MKLVPAATDDLDALNNIVLESKMHWGYPKEWLENWMDDLLLKETDFERQSVFKLQHGRQTIGVSAVWEHPTKYELTNLWLKPDFIGKGLGKFLLHETLRRAVTKSKPVVLEADPNAAGFYEKQGFTVIGQKESHPRGRFLPVMRRDAP